MEKIPFTLLEFQKRFRTDEDCLLAIEQMRWPRGFMCSKCGHDGGYKLSMRRVIECAVCNHQTSITAGTVFHSTRIPLVNWFWIIYLVAQDKGGASALRIAKHLNMHYKTVWLILHKLRETMSRRDDEAIRLAGLIEMDEAYFGGKKRKTQVLVMIEAGKKASGNLVMKRIFGRMASEPEVKRVVEAHVDNESQQHFVSDCAMAHGIVKKIGHKLETHKSTPQSAAQKLPWVHLTIMLAKQFILGTYHGVSRKHLQKYLDEFCYRHNRRFKESQLHESLLRACVSVPSPA